MREPDKNNISLVCDYIEEILQYCEKIDYLDFIHDRKTLTIIKELIRNFMDDNQGKFTAVVE